MTVDMYTASRNEYLKDLRGRIGRVNRSFDVLKRPDGPYGVEHQNLLAFYGAMLAAGEALPPPPAKEPT